MYNKKTLSVEELKYVRFDDKYHDNKKSKQVETCADKWQTKIYILYWS